VKVTRATRASLKFATAHKRSELRRVLSEYAGVVNHFIQAFWKWSKAPSNKDCTADLYNTASTWLSPTMRQIAAREALAMVTASRERDGESAVMPLHKGKSMRLTEQVVKQSESDTDSFDLWLTFTAIAADKSVRFTVPVKRHKHFNRLAKKGRLLKSYTVSEDGIQFAFEIETGEKKKGTRAVGIDTGINALASLSTGEQYGTDIKGMIERIKRCKLGSKGQQKAIRTLKQRIAEVAKQIASRDDIDLVVVENLHNLSHQTKLKGRLSRSVRSSIGKWNWRLWLERLERACEMYRVRLRRVCPRYTSQTCNRCGHVDRSNRNGEAFRCLECGHADNADLNAARNILSRFSTGIYGSRCEGSDASVSATIVASVPRGLASA
jgi:IS605 OrfB family transposase